MEEKGKLRISMRQKDEKSTNGRIGLTLYMERLYNYSEMGSVRVGADKLN